MNVNNNYSAHEKGYTNAVTRKQDAYSKGIQNQIANAQKQLQELSSREGLSPEEKIKKRQEIQKQITDLNNQLRQHEIEKRKEKQRAKENSMDEMLGGTNKDRKGKNAGRHKGLSQAGMEAMISADTAMSQAEVQKSVATDMEGRARILKSEIRQDASRGGGTADKEEALAELEQKATDAKASQIDILERAGKEVNESAKEDTPEEDREESGKEKQEEENSPQAVSVNVLV